MKADILLTKGKILSVDKKDTEYEAVGIKGNKIVFTGTSKEAD